MSDDAQMARLVELARRVALAEEPDVNLDSVTVEMTNHAFGDNSAWALDGRFLIQRHPRALDALEAALCVLAGEPQQWVVELAEEWRKRGYDGNAVREVYGWAADELLAAAKGGAR